MRIEIDDRPSTVFNEVFGAIRLYPENNEEITKLEWLFNVFKQGPKNNFNEDFVKAEIIKVSTGSYHHAIIYRKGLEQKI